VTPEHTETHGLTPEHTETHGVCTPYKTPQSSRVFGEHDCTQLFSVQLSVLEKGIDTPS